MWRLLVPLYVDPEAIPLTSQLENPTENRSTQDYAGAYLKLCWFDHDTHAKMEFRTTFHCNTYIYGVGNAEQGSPDNLENPKEESNKEFSNVLERTKKQYLT